MTSRGPKDAATAEARAGAAPAPARAAGMLAVVNTTSFAAASFAEGSRNVIVVRGTFDVAPTVGVRRAGAQPAPVGADVAFPDADPAVSAARYESDFVPFKPVADCLLVGTAHPPGGASAGCVVSFSVGRHFDKSILVVGDRQWVPRMGGLRVGATEPGMFTSMPLTFANAYGGQDPTAGDAGAFFAPNPAGKGYAVSSKTAVGRPLPNLEDPGRPLKGWSDRVEPRGFGPVGRTWQPRAGRAGTYDQRWQRERAPSPPSDFSERYYNAAPDDQQVEAYLRGDEEVRLTNLHPTHSTVSFRLPGVRLRAVVAGAPAAAVAIREVRVFLDTLWVDADALQCVLVWRARIDPVPGDARVLLVEEEVNVSPMPPETYRPILRRLDATTAEAARAEAALFAEEPERGADGEDLGPDD